MTAEPHTNPYHLLGLPTDADPPTIVQRAEDLCTVADSDDDRAAYNWARQELIRDPLTRARHAVLEMPGTDYRDELWEDFDRRNRRNPADLRALRAQARPLDADAFDLGAILDLLLDGLLVAPEADVTAALRQPPVKPDLGAPPLGVADVLFG